MQVDFKNYNPIIHDKFIALSIKQPYASMMRNGDKTIDLQKKYTPFRGDVLICSSNDREHNGTSIALAELYDIKKISELTESEKQKVMAQEYVFKQYEDSYAYIFKRVRPVIEFPIIGKSGIWQLIYDKNLIIEYPKYIKINFKKKWLRRFLNI